jgi:hypothetical protein
VAWRKRNLFGKTGTQDNCGPRKEFAATRIRTTRSETVVWRSENFVRKDWTRNQAKRGTPKRRKDGERQWKDPECNNGIWTEAYDSSYAAKRE